MLGEATKTGHGPATGAPVVETTHGKLRGSVANGVQIFKGIRYADTTAGRNRFLPPQAPAKWAGVKDAVQWGASAPQLPVRENTDPFYSWYGEIQPISEDCLFLNVFTPDLSASKRPVLFWIHGGGWREFSGTAPGFDGTNLARAEDVVVITVNHRLSVFGYLQLNGSHDQFADSGNAGLLDIVMALEWARDNVAAFGGDPDNVTIFGESGGASKIAAILSMKAARGLFHKAVLQSSAGGLRLASREEGSQLAHSLARVLGHQNLSGDELQSVPVEQLLSAAAAVGKPFRGMIDGRSFDADPYYLSAPAIATNIPIMVGYTNTETTYHLRFDPQFASLQLGDVKRRLMRFLVIDAARTDDIINAYRNAYPSYSPGEILTMVTSDFTFKRTAIRIAGLQAATATAPVYAYAFERETPIEGGLMHCPHTSEVPFIFGTTDAARAQVGGGDDVAQLTRTMMASWAAFARSGNPNNPNLPEWKPFKDTDRQTMVLNAESRAEVDPGGQARASLDGLPYYGYSYAISHFTTG